MVIAALACAPCARWHIGVPLVNRADQLQQVNDFRAHLLDRHLTGDWGDIHPEDRGLNEEALRTGARIFSVYGPDGFLTTFKGAVVPASTTTGQIPLVTAALDTANATVTLTLANSGSAAISYTLTPNEYEGSTQTVTVAYAGVSWGSKFATQPGFLPTPLPVISGQASQPSTVDVYVDGVKRMSQPVARIAPRG